MELTKDGANAVLDAVGGSLGTKLIKCIAPFGKLIIYGMLRPGETSFTNGALIYKNLKIEGFGIDHWFNNKTAAELGLIWEELTTAVAENKLKLCFDKIFNLKEVEQAILFYKNTGGKIILR